MTKEDLISLQQKATMLRVEGKYKETIENCYTLLEAGIELKNYKSILTAYIYLGASFYCIGVTNNLSLKELNFSELFNIADIRLYKAKQNGRNQVCAVS
ncbi:hypothetical protein JK636_01825 [Clostridium sp. YIM B02515]|uniref:Uncharacterized protein n=1 Tax=Clostridium rhizosphaerae TaxID=2803861 RepID=A0ABS1T8Z8_9CLOT|nr:hypothetical protein [Clostridium rhizosphaerae]MBL4934493.1 hypothetical protein [Clostridium rhizosphaerae]